MGKGGGICSSTRRSKVPTYSGGEVSSAQTYQEGKLSRYQVEESSIKGTVNPDTEASVPPTSLQHVEVDVQEISLTTPAADPAPASDAIKSAKTANDNPVHRAWETSEDVEVVHHDIRSLHHPAPTKDTKYHSTYKTHSHTHAHGERKPLSILHFNDVYEIGEGKQEPVGGAARFSHLLSSFKEEDPLVLFSGDALNPSLLSQMTHGLHMIECLNEMGIAAACVGNHDMDFGVENLHECLKASNFPWLCSNCWHTDSGEPLGGAFESVIIVHSGYKIGIMGLIEDDWLVCCTTVRDDDLQYTDFVEVGRELAVKLRQEDGCDVVIALTHFREPNDMRLAQEAPEIDLVLGGHDHHYASAPTDPHGIWYVKSGCDFRYLSKILYDPLTRNTTVEKLGVTSDIPEDPVVGAIVRAYLEKQGAAMKRVMGTIRTEMNAIFADVRTRETNCGNWLADIMRAGCHADVALLNSGCMRADVIFPKGDFTVEDMNKLLPFSNELMVVAVTGRILLKLLENSVSKWPVKEGRFAQVSNIKFTFDGNKPAGSRVISSSVMIGSKHLQMDQEYTVAALEFAAMGKEGYEAFLEGTVVMDEEQCTPLLTLVVNHLRCMEVFVRAKTLTFRKDLISRKFDRATSRKNGSRFLLEKNTSNIHAHNVGKAWHDWTQSKVFKIDAVEEGRIRNIAVAHGSVEEL